MTFDSRRDGLETCVQTSPEPRRKSLLTLAGRRSGRTGSGRGFKGVRVLKSPAGSTGDVDGSGVENSPLGERRECGESSVTRVRLARVSDVLRGFHESPKFGG